MKVQVAMHRNWMHSISRSISSRMRRGVSLVELLVGIGVVLAIAAIVIPWTAGWLGGRELDNAEDGLAMQMVMARAAAREEGRPVEVVAESDAAGSRIKARWMPRGEDDASGAGRDAAQGSPINASWASMKLPQGVRVALGIEPAFETSASRDAFDDFPSAGDEDPFSGGSGELGARGQTLAIFLPDGTVFFAPIFMLRTDAGSLRAMQVNRSNGVPQQVADGDEPESGQADTDSPR